MPKSAVNAVKFSGKYRNIPLKYGKKNIKGMIIKSVRAGYRTVCGRAELLKVFTELLRRFAEL